MNTININRGSAVFVCTGYSDSQMHLHGFAGRVVAIRGERYQVRNGRGEVVICASPELQLISERDGEYLPGVMATPA